MLARGKRRPNGAREHGFHTIDGAIVEAARGSPPTTPPLAGLALRGFGVWRTGAGLLITPPRLNGNHPFLIASHRAASDLVEQVESTLEIAVLDACSARQFRRERDVRRDPSDGS